MGNDVYIPLYTYSYMNNPFIFAFYLSNIVLIHSYSIFILSRY